MVSLSPHVKWIYVIFVLKRKKKFIFGEISLNQSFIQHEPKVCIRCLISHGSVPCPLNAPPSEICGLGLADVASEPQPKQPPWIRYTTHPQMRNLLEDHSAIYKALKYSQNPYREIETNIYWAPAKFLSLTLALLHRLVHLILTTLPGWWPLPLPSPFYGQASRGHVAMQSHASNVEEVRPDYHCGFITL